MKEIGRRLKTRREELGLTMEQVQAETKIRRRYLEALESGREDPIPGEVYVKGFLRFYANFLGLDGPAMVKEYNEWKRIRAAEAAPPRAERDRRRGGTHAARPKTSPPPLAAPAGKETQSAGAAGAATPTARGKVPAAPRGPIAAPRLASREETALAAEGAPPRRPGPAAGVTPPKGSGSAAEGASPRRIEGQTAPALKPAPSLRDGQMERVLISAAVVLMLVVAAALWYTWSHAQPAAGNDTGSGNGQGLPAGEGVVPGGSGSASGGNGGGDNGSGPGGPGGDGGSGSRPHWAVVSESAGSASYVVYGAPFTVSLEIVSERCWLRVTSDGQPIFEKTLNAGVTGQWTAQTSLVIRFGRPQLVKVSVDGLPLGLAGAKDEPRTLEFSAGSAPDEGGGTGGEGTGQAGSGGA